MNSFSVSFPYSIGTYLETEENGQNHIDQVYGYSLDKNGVYVTLLLEAFTVPRLSRKIDINDLINNWKIYEQQDNKNNPKLLIKK